MNYLILSMIKNIVTKEEGESRHIQTRLGVKIISRTILLLSCSLFCISNKMRIIFSIPITYTN